MDTPASPLVRRSFLKASAGLAAATATPRFLSAAERAAAGSAACASAQARAATS
jgi:hypothetical protein